LVGEISTLSNSLSILQEDVKDPDSALVRAGEDRVRMVNEMVHNISLTLQSLEKVAKKYEILGSGSKKRRLWARFKWSVEMTSIDGLRNKLVYHNTVMNLLLTSVGNSSLQRIESSTDALENDVREIKSYITGQYVTERSLIPSISAMDSESEKLTLSASFMQNAEVLQPWSTIGVDQWIESGRWWLIRSQMELYTVSESGQEVPLAAYTSLMKASWILIDIIACHPQVPFLSAKTHSEVQILSAEIKTEFQRLRSLGAVIPDLRDLESQDLRIWESQTRGPLLRPHRGPMGSDNSRSQDKWRVEGGEEVLFQGFAKLKIQALPETIPCIILFLVNEERNDTRLLAQNQNGSVVFANSFEEEVHLSKTGGQVVYLNGEQIAFASAQDALVLCSVIEGSNFYHFGTKVKDWSTLDLKALILMFAVKAQRRETATHFLEKLPPRAMADTAPLECLPAIAYHLAIEQAREAPNDTLKHQTKLPCPRDMLPLFQWAIEFNYVELATLLIAKEAMETSGDSWRQMTPLGLACWYGHEDIVRKLLRDARIRQPNGEWPLHPAAHDGHTGIVRLLLRNGAEVNSCNNSGLTPLHYAARNGQEKTAELLIERGANLESKSHGQRTPLHEACDTKQETIIAILAKEGARFDQPKAEGMYPYHVALHSGLSTPAFDLVSSQHYAQTRGPPPDLKKRVADLTWEVGSDWAMLTLDSEGAYFELKDPLPENVTLHLGKFIRVDGPAGWVFRCKVVFQTKQLHLSTGHGSWYSRTDFNGRTTLQVSGEGPSGMTTIVKTSETGHPTNFISHEMIAFG